jgi:uncharacterized membrane protein YhaH (DUF805 family)
VFGTFVALAGSLFNAVANTHIVSGIATLVMFLPNLAVFVRRLHDIDRSGWWVLSGWWLLLPFVSRRVLFNVIALELILPAFGGAAANGLWLWHLGIYFSVLVALVISIVPLVWVCARGTLGPNRYGPDPLIGAISELRG